MVYDPKQPWKPDTKPEGNPWLIHYEGENSGWRPMAICKGYPIDSTDHNM
jgi:hypothetical protein